MNNLTPIGKMIIIAVIVLILAGIGILIWWYVQPDEEPGPEEPPATSRAIDEFIAAYDFTMNEHPTVDKIKFIGLEAVPYLCEITQGPSSGKARFIAYVSLSGLALENPGNQDAILPCLKQGLTDTDDSLRAQAAQLLINLGDKDGFPVLIETLDIAKPMIPSEPPININEWVSLVLGEYTEFDYGMDQEEWQAWWDENKDTLKFDLTQQKYSS